MIAAGFAPAKINLFLKVWPPGPDGYHPLQSWMVFADVGDRVELRPESDGLVVTGPFAKGVPADAGNLCLRARDAFLAEAGGEGVGLFLDKQLPPASGIGGGSSDAAAVLRLLQARRPIAEAALARIALGLGADVPACLKATSLMARGRGEAISPAPTIPLLPAVLVNPGVAVSTAAVFSAFDREGGASAEWTGGDEAMDVAGAIALIAPMGNDLQRAAQVLAPQIGDVIRVLEGDPRARLARMSGSGATSFALCETAEAAQGLAADLAAAHPGWWVRAATLT